MQEIAIPDITTINSDLLDQQLRAAATIDYIGNKMGFGAPLTLIVSDAILQSTLDQLKAICANHDPNELTTTQQAKATGKVDTADMLAKADKAITDIGTKLATFQATPNLANASPLLIELAQDVTAMIKAIKFIAKQI